MCGDCSKRRVNSLRVCDVCFVKQAFKEDEIQRNETVNSRGDKLVKAQDKLKYDKEEVIRKKEELEEFEKKVIKNYSMSILNVSNRSNQIV